MDTEYTAALSPAALVALANPEVTIVYCEPAYEVTAVAASVTPDWANVIADAPFDETTVQTEPPKASKIKVS
jgi:hypothetical protein